MRAAEASAADSLEGERKIVTALFADLKGSTTLMEALDPEVAHAIVAPLLRIMIDAVQRYEGYVARTTGDGIFALFGAPTAYEDHPQRALYAALEMQQKLRAYREQRVAQGQRSLEARVGVHTGEVVAYAAATGDKVEYRLVGHTANLAARLEALAPAGSIAISEYTGNLCEGYFELRELGPMTVKGLSAPIEVYEVLGLGPLRSHFQLAARRGLTRFVGRERELEQMQQALQLSLGGHGQVVAVMADAGTGKSRLFHEFKATIPTTCKVIEAYSVSHGKASAWLPVLELLRGYFGIDAADAAPARRVKVESALIALDPTLADMLPYLFGLLGIVERSDPIAQMDPTIKRQRTLDAIKRIILSESLKQPVVVIFEDLHWVDTQTQALLHLLVDSVARTNILILLSYRPEYHHEWTNKSYYTQLRLDPLSAADGTAMLTALLGEAVELDPLKRLIAERTGGSPFFIEEIVRALFDEGALSRNGVVKVTRSVSQLRLPPTVQGMLAARIDRLAPMQKDLLQTLAVIGRESPLDLLRQVASYADTQLERALADLQAGEFIFEQPVVSGTEYVFKHALTHEVAYNSLLIERRKRLHERAGQAIESIYAANPNDHITSLAHHFSRADDHRKAIEYLGKAGQQAIQRSAHQDAIKSIRDALGRIPMLPEDTVNPDQAASLWSALGISLQMTNGYASDEVGFAYARAREMSTKAQDDLGLAVTLRGIYLFNLVRAEYRNAQQAGRDLIALGGRNSSYTQEGHVCLGLALEYLGEFTSSDEAFVKALSLESASALADRVQYSGNSRTLSRSYYALCLAHLGQFDRALALSRQALALAEQLSLPITTAQSLGVHAIILHKLRAYPTATLYYDKTVACASRHGFPYWLTLASMLKSLLPTGRADNASKLAGFEPYLAGLRATGTRLGTSWYLALRAELLAETGRFEEALASIEEALAFVADTAERMNEANALRVKGAILLARSRHAGGDGLAEAEASFTTSLSIATRQQAKLWELRAAISLACVRAHRGHFEEGLELLRPVYVSFTEGFAMPDLVDARRLLEYLGRSGAGAVPLSDVAGSALLAR